ncbi:MAG TPA: hypothetical protein VMG08_21510 [Allosphingosinicella sp.]|nr:hypothetical protein [Allosphingosinicella sp.]
MNRVFLTTRLYGRVMKWDTDNQIEIDVFQGLVRSHGFYAVFGNSACMSDTITTDEAGDISKVSFWMRIRGQYQPLTLAARTPDVFVIDI